jgi:hypothetical protein
MLLRVLVAKKGGIMKPRNFIKKLTLNKKTIVHLNNDETKEVVGGADPTVSFVVCCAEMTYGQGSCETVCYTVNSAEKSVVLCCAPYYCVG